MTDSAQHTRPDPVRGPFVYTGDNGVRWGVGLLIRVGTHPSLGFEQWDPSDKDVHPAPASGLKMRYINVVSAETGRRRQVPVGNVFAPILAPSASPRTLNMYDPYERRTLTYAVTSYVGEQRRGLRHSDV
jgi:hypothetical protein